MLGVLVSVVLAGGEPAPGFRLFSSSTSDESWLVDVGGEVVHTWTSDSWPFGGLYLDADGTLLRGVNDPFVSTGPPGSGEGVQRLDFDGDVLWEYELTDGVPHHDIEPMPNGNVLMIVWEELTAADAIAAGRAPGLLEGDDWLPDSIVELKPTGPTSADVVWEWRLMDHVVQDFDASRPNFGNPADHPELLDLNFPPNVAPDGDWNHCNAISYDPLRDLVLLNSPFQEELWIIDHSTTTAEAASHTGGNHGKGGDLLYRWGNPQAYGAGTDDDQQLFFAHAAHFVPEGLPGAGNLLIFNNRAGLPFGDDFSAVIEIELPPDFSLVEGGAFGPAAPLWEFTTPNPEDFYSPIVSSARRLPNGNTLVCAGAQNGWLFEVTPDEQIVWEFFNDMPSPLTPVFMATYVERSLWADRSELSAASGGTVELDLVAGSEHAGDFYLVLGSFSGTSPGLPLTGQVHLPLNPDPYTTLTATSPNTFLADSLGVLDPSGNGAAAMVVPPGSAGALVGLVAHHSFFTALPATLAIRFAGNAERLEFVP